MRRTLAVLALAALLPLPGLSAEITVKPGETLSEIADRHGVSLGRLMKLNGIDDADHLDVGQRLKLPDSGAAAGAAGGGGGDGTVTVEAGQTLSEIAERHDISLERLMKLNGIDDADHVEVGQTLKLRGAGSTPARSFTYEKGASEHVVRPGESLSAIASGYGVPLSRLVALNRIEDPDKVKAGRTLKLAGEAPAATTRPQTPAATATASKAEADTDTDDERATEAEAEAPRPTARPKPAQTPATVARASATPAPAQAPAGGTQAADWRSYGPLKVDWANWQPMGGSLVAPTMNEEGKAFYLAINCESRKLNATRGDSQWQTWNDPKADFEEKMVSDLCRSRGN